MKMQISKENMKPVRAGYLCVGDVISYRDMANPYQEWTIIDTRPDIYFGRIAVIKNNTDGYVQTCISPISFKRDNYAGWKFVRSLDAGETPASQSKTHKCLANMQEHRLEDCPSLQGFKVIEMKGGNKNGT